ncbi:hypothetical protein BO82DRAFT_351220 [Aspergillus uvarum CBS 121591]|uniref:Uncharacterized protein n=1 Tax=Aspergillus uvarum CBS 121591 TaxID=1448315 RepID=A0A319E2L2_9EURO|nr:hypothetical protein BO82DRAFT_351220 [Aspergillus uvarum CBS 121591]PYH85372.1 hypothetical protein BO82DRAFT_351220 [Aspergillus uvarum CBS 121591]
MARQKNHAIRTSPINDLRLVESSIPEITGMALHVGQEPPRHSEAGASTVHLRHK